ncbi:MAG: threonine/serine exporter ThrE family protein [Candidatus Avoscillospira sp.]
MEYNVLMDLAADIGCRMATAGAETYRIEESINRILGSYGIQSQVYSIPNSLIITILEHDDTPVTRLCRIDNHGTDLDAVERYSNLSRRICAETPEPEEARIWLWETDAARKHYPFPIYLLGHILASSGFAVFFGGSLRDSLCAGICGLLLGLVTHLLDRVQTNSFFKTIAASFLMALTAYALAALGLPDHVNASIIGTLMLLVPGLLFTNALRDIIFGDTNSGIDRIVAVVLVAAALALGTGAAWNVADRLWGITVSETSLPIAPVYQCLFSVVACTGFVAVFNLHGYGIAFCALGGGLTWAAYCIVEALGGSELLCYFIATIAAAVFSEIMARIRKYPAISYLVISLLPLLPGAGIYYAAQSAVANDMSRAAAYGTHTLAIAGSMAVGILIVVTGVRILNRQLLRRRSRKQPGKK